MTDPSPDREPTIELEEDRYARLRLIPWWDQSLLRESRVMVIGAGALGNEIVKDLALLGIGTILVVDFDEIETSNLSRSVLYRSADRGNLKAHAAVSAVHEINPECRAYALHADVRHGVGLGVFRWADVVICGLDNTAARLAVNRACWKVNTPLVDGATESLQGVARVFKPPDGVCFECTMSEKDEKLMAVRNSCGFLAEQAYRRDRTPTTPTTSAIIAGIQVQEAVKLLHKKEDMPNLIGKGYYFDGNTYDCFVIEYQRKEDCLSHETYDNIVETALTSSAALEDVFREAQAHLPGEVTIDLPGEMVTKLECSKCGSKDNYYRLLDTISVEEAKCPKCGSVRIPDVVSSCKADCDFAAVPLRDLGFGIMQIIAARSGDAEAQIEISGDLEKLFGGQDEPHK